MRKAVRISVCSLSPSAILSTISSTPCLRRSTAVWSLIFSSFAGVPIQRLGETLGVLVTQSKESRKFSSEEIYALEVVAMVLAEMTELGLL